MNTYEWKPIPVLSPENGNHGASCGSCNSKLAKPKDSPVSHHRLTAPLLLLQQHPQTQSSLHKAEVLHQLSGMHRTPHSSSHRSTSNPWALGWSSPRSPPTLPTDQRLWLVPRWPGRSSARGGRGGLCPVAPGYAR